MTSDRAAGTGARQHQNRHGRVPRAERQPSGRCIGPVSLLRAHAPTSAKGLPWGCPQQSLPVLQGARHPPGPGQRWAAHPSDPEEAKGAPLPWKNEHTAPRRRRRGLGSAWPSSAGHTQAPSTHRGPLPWGQAVLRCSPCRPPRGGQSGGHHAGSHLGPRPPPLTPAPQDSVGPGLLLSPSPGW